MRPVLAVAMLALSTAFALSTPVMAAETCHVDAGGQFGKITLCVSSVLPPQGANSYGPEHLIGRAGNENTAWCEGVAGPGIGESITEKLDGSYTAHDLAVINGYAKSAAAFRANGRIKSAVLETSRGYKATVTLKDTPEPQRIAFPKSKVSWVRLTITAVYAGESTDTCVSQFAIVLDEDAP